MTALLSTDYCSKMEKFKAKVCRLANRDPNKPLSPVQIALIHQKLTVAFPDLRTPTHPTYSAMIQTAIKKLNEEGGSKEELISEYIKKNNEGLPWAHDMYLRRHLSKLCENGEIVYNSASRCYTLPECAGPQEDNSKKKGRKRRLVRKSKGSVTEDKKGNLVGEKMVEDSGDMIGFPEEGVEEVRRNEGEERNVSGSFGVEASGILEADVEESKPKPRRRSLVLIEECDEVGTTTLDEGEQNAVVQRRNEKLAREDGDGDTSDAANIGGENVYELPVRELGLKENTNHAQVGIQDGYLRKQQGKEKLEWKRKRHVNEDDNGDIGGEKAVEVSENLIEFQEENNEECGKSRAKPRIRSLVVTEDNVEVGRTAFDEEEQNLVIESCNEVSAHGDTNDTDKMMLVPAECVESPSTLIPSSVANIRCDNVSELAVNELPLKERDLMIVPYKGSVCEVSAEVNPIPDSKDKIIVCGLTSFTEQIRPGRKKLQPKRLIASPRKRKQRNTKVSLETMPSLPALAADYSLIEHHQLQELLRQRTTEPKLIAARLKSTKLSPINQSRQACTSSLLEGTSTEQLDMQKNFKPSQLSSLENPMSMEDEENLPLQKVLEKCGKRKKQMGQKFTTSTPSVTATANFIGSNSLLDLPTSECTKHQLNDQERQGQMDVKLGYVEASISSFVEGDVPDSYQKCEQEPKESEAAKDDADGFFDLHLQPPEGLDKLVTNLPSQKQTKPLKMDGQRKTIERTETSKEGVAGFSNMYACEQEGLFEPATDLHSQQQINLEEDAQGRPLKHLEAAKNVATITLDLHRQQQAGSSEPETAEAAKNDATITSDLHHQQQAGSSEPETAVQVKREGKRGRGRPRKDIGQSKEGQESEETNKKPKTVSQKRSRKQQDVNKEDSAVLLEPALKLEEKEHIINDCPEESQSEAHEPLERGQATFLSSDVDIHQRKQNVDGGADQPDKQQEELNCDEIEVKQGKSDVESQVSHPKEKSRKCAKDAIQVPLSSKDQLRSRIKHQSQDRTKS